MYVVTLSRDLGYNYIHIPNMYIEMTTPQQRWNQQNPEVIAKATQKWKSKKVRIEFFLEPGEAEPLMKMAGSRSGNAKRLLLEALKELED